ncbi:hypothetical protein V8C86DRAFT_1822678 [Haematococcus lacustris]
MDDRCQRFMLDAQSCKQPEKEMSRLRKFLFKNQEHRFTDSEQGHLFQAVQLHVTAALAAAGGGGVAAAAALSLVEDCLKMPFSVFSTSQKKTMLKWLDKLQDSSDGAGQRGTPAVADAVSGAESWSVMDTASEGSVSVMNDAGDEKDVSAGSPEQYQSIHSALARGCAVTVRLDATRTCIVSMSVDDQ